MSANPCPGECVLFDDARALVVLKDPKAGAAGQKNSSVYRASNPRRRNVSATRVDGCCIEHRTGKGACDFLLLADESDAWLIERKTGEMDETL